MRFVEFLTQLKQLNGINSHSDVYVETTDLEDNTNLEDILSIQVDEDGDVILKTGEEEEEE